MSKYEMDDVELVTIKEANSEGRVYLGKRFAGKEVEIAVRRTGGEEDD